MTLKKTTTVEILNKKKELKTFKEQLSGYEQRAIELKEKIQDTEIHIEKATSDLNSNFDNLIDDAVLEVNNLFVNSSEIIAIRTEEDNIAIKYRNAKAFEFGRINGDIKIVSSDMAIDRNAAIFIGSNIGNIFKRIEKFLK